MTSLLISPAYFNFPVVLNRIIYRRILGELVAVSGDVTVHHKDQIIF